MKRNPKLKYIICCLASAGQAKRCANLTEDSIISARHARSSMRYETAESLKKLEACSLRHEFYAQK